jgi:hypothetical protein
MPQIITYNNGVRVKCEDGEDGEDGEGGVYGEDGGHDRDGDVAVNIYRSHLRRQGKERRCWSNLKWVKCEVVSVVSAVFALYLDQQ